MDWSQSLLGRALLVLAPLGLIVLLQLREPEPEYISPWQGSAVVIQNITAHNQDSASITQVGLGMSAGIDPDQPYGNPLQSSAAVMTQGYGVGTHAPANAWGAVDLAIDGNGDGVADPSGSRGAPISATHRGVVQLTPNSYPAGNHIWLSNDRFKTGYSHLDSFAVQNGDLVERGTLIGYVGSSGLSSGPHLDYQVWADGVNVNPLEYGAFD
jgi:murein DD-endopeptidase MepM/ murein hydrolase activator NlpD